MIDERYVYHAELVVTSLFFCFNFKLDILPFLRKRVSSVAVGRPLSVLGELDGEVANHAHAKDHEDHDQLREDADLGLEDVGHDEAQALPEAVVGEGGLLVRLKQDAVQSCKETK